MQNSGCKGNKTKNFFSKAIHWMLLLYKKKSKNNASNYRGVHLACQLSQVIERILGYYSHFFFEASNAYGQNQFTYMRNCGYTHCLAFNICCWLKAFHDKKRLVSIALTFLVRLIAYAVNVCRKSWKNQVYING